MNYRKMVIPNILVLPQSINTSKSFTKKKCKSFSRGIIRLYTYFFQGLTTDKNSV